MVEGIEMGGIGGEVCLVVLSMPCGGGGSGGSGVERWCFVWEAKGEEGTGCLKKVIRLG